MATSALDLVVITPERQILQSPAESVVIPAHDGELGILHDRAPLMCELGIGQLRYTHQGQTRRLFVDGGFAQVFENHVVVLTTRALPAQQITTELLAAAEKAVGTHQGYDADTRHARELAQRRVYALRALQAAV